jgi:hypothetical protein
MICVPDKHSEPTERQTFFYRIAVICSLIVTAIVCGVGSYLLLNELEERLVSSQYASFHKNFKASIASDLDSKVISLDIQANFLESKCPDTTSWPNCSISRNSWTAISDNLIDIATTRTVSFSPILNASQLFGFESFARDFYVKESYDAEMSIAPTTNYINMRRGVWTSVNGTPQREIDASSAKGQHDIIVPVFEIGKFSSNKGAIMYNIYSEANRARAIDEVVDCASSSATECNSVTDFICIVQNEECSPAALLMRPVFPLNDNTTLVGLSVGVFEWSRVLRAATSSHIEGIYIVVESLVEPITDQPSMYTFQFHHAQVRFVGGGDRHDHKYDSWRESTELSLSQGGRPMYRVHMFPSDSYFRLYKSWGPLFGCLLSVVLIVLTSLIFVRYDMVLDRQRRDNILVMNTRRQFVRFISHEIRTPLNTINLGMQILLDEVATAMQNFKNVLPNELYESLNEWLGIVSDMSESADTAVYVLNDLVSYDKISLGSFDIDCEYHNIWEILHASVKPFRLQSQRSGIELLLDFHVNRIPTEHHYDEYGKICGCNMAMSHLMVYGDKMKLEKVIGNLISNALDFTPPGGKIVFSGKIAFIADRFSNFI